MSEENKVVPLRPKDKTKEVVKPENQKEEKDFNFEEIQRRNEENRQRQKKDRQQANKGVIRSYRLKD